MPGTRWDPADVSRETAAAIFGDRLDLAVSYARLLRTEGVRRGLIGPRESGRLWDRHLLNCAVIAPGIDHGSTVVDVGSGAGLPGIVLAVARPDLSIRLVEPMQRRAVFLTEVVAELGLDRVSVLRARAEDLPGSAAPADVVTARAVAPLGRLAGWCLPLARPGGLLLAMKGARAHDELAAAAPDLARLGAGSWSVDTFGMGVVDPAVQVVRVVRSTRPGGPRSTGTMPG